jgi:chromate transporter
MVTPSIIIVLVVAGYMEKFSHSKTLEHAFVGLRPAVTGLIAVAGFDIVRIAVIQTEIDPKKIIYFLIIFYMIKRFNKHPVTYVAISAVIGILLGF